MATARQTLKRLLLGREIAWLRVTRGLSQTQLGTAVGIRQNRFPLLEDGRATITDAQLEAILDHLGVVDDAYRSTLRSMHEGSDHTGDWSTGYRRAYGEDLRLLIELESMADQYFVVDSEVIPGMLWDERYARAKVGPKLRHNLTVDEVVHAWMERQKILHKEDAPEFHAVLTESCLTRRYAEDNAVMRGALQHLINVSQLQGVLIQVLPDDVRAVRTPRPSTLLRVPTAGKAGPLRMAYLDSDGEITYTDKQSKLDYAESQLRDLSASALDADNTRDFISFLAGRNFR
jgi:transcriptional regulator with XRE-family HTH domain